MKVELFCVSKQKMKRAAVDISQPVSVDSDQKDYQPVWRELDVDDSKTTLLKFGGASWVTQCRLGKDLRKQFAIGSEAMRDLWALRPSERSPVNTPQGKVLAPRYNQSYGRSYTFSGTEHPALDLPPLLQPFMDWANACCATMLKRDYQGRRFNMCFVNWYKDGAHYIGWHGDDERELYRNKRDETLVFSISLGQQRRFLMRVHPKKQQPEKSGPELELALGHGDCLVMGGLCQQHYQHSVPKVSGKKATEMGGRVNLTFRLFK
jgi:alkylated DNA repair dioxygenase AlkB